MGERALFVVPAFNEEPNIGAVIDDLLSAAPPASILVVSDGSRDATARIARERGVACADFPFNAGVACAVKAGFRHAMRHGFGAVVQFDGDGQHLASEVGSVLDPVLRGECDIAVGYRSGLKHPVSSKARMVGRIVLTGWLMILTRRYHADPTSGFRAYSRRAIQAFAEDFPEEYPEVESLVLARKLGLSVGGYPVMMRPRQAGRSSISFAGSIYYMIKVVLSTFVILLRRYERT